MHFCNSLRVKTVDFVHAFVCESKLLKVKHILCVCDLSYICPKVHDRLGCL